MLTQNEEAFRALDYGADDFDLPIEDEVTQKAGARIDLDLERLLEIPRRLGYRVDYRRAERPAAVAASWLGIHLVALAPGEPMSSALGGRPGGLPRAERRGAVGSSRSKERPIRAKDLVHYPPGRST